MNSCGDCHIWENGKELASVYLREFCNMIDGLSLDANIKCVLTKEVPQ